jgi:hypothetical protein
MSENSAPASIVTPAILSVCSQPASSIEARRRVATPIIVILSLGTQDLNSCGKTCDRRLGSQLHHQSKTLVAPDMAGPRNNCLAIIVLVL